MLKPGADLIAHYLDPDLQYGPSMTSPAGLRGRAGLNAGLLQLGAGFIPLR